MEKCIDLSSVCNYYRYCQSFTSFANSSATLHLGAALLVVIWSVLIQELQTMAKLGTTNMRPLLSLDALSFYALTNLGVCVDCFYCNHWHVFRHLEWFLDVLFFASWYCFVSGAAAAFNCLIEEKIDAMMAVNERKTTSSGSSFWRHNLSSLLAA